MGSTPGFIILESPVLGTPCLYLTCLPCCTKGQVQLMGRRERAINLFDGPSPDTYSYLLSLALTGQELASAGSQAELKALSCRQRFVLLPTVSRNPVGWEENSPCLVQLVTQLHRCSQPAACTSHQSKDCN
ncbi:hypothetical protein QYF61_024450 [Mycteria americana]|uniref:Uncharacterized protein n=1 Tax=Mycteria americana TaxID=33587 RepID=A0AAN7MS00_MYCAM|nr:hypothetical protein QYF61_024450 [Mycteria americana]